MGVLTGSRIKSGSSDNGFPSLVIAQLTGRIVHADDLAQQLLGIQLEELLGIDIREFFSVEIPPAGSVTSKESLRNNHGNWINQAAALFSPDSGRYELFWRPVQIGWMSYWLVTCRETENNLPDAVNERLFNGLPSDLTNAFRLTENYTPDNTHWKHISFHKPARGNAGGGGRGGDLLVVEDISRDHLFYFIGDIAGHHKSADVVRMMVMSYLKVYASELDITEARKFPGKLLNRLNNALCQDEKNDSLLTGLVLLLEKRGKRAWFASAGHQPMYLIHPVNGHTEITTSGIPLGINPKVRYKTMELNIEPDERLVCYTDGLISSGPSNGFTRGHDSLKNILEACKNCPSDNLAGNLEKLWQGVERNESDIKTDITFTVISMDTQTGPSNLRALN